MDTYQFGINSPQKLVLDRSMSFVQGNPYVRVKERFWRTSFLVLNGENPQNMCDAPNNAWLHVQHRSSVPPSSVVFYH